MDSIKSSLNLLRFAVNDIFNGKEPWQIMSMTASTVLLNVWLWNFVFDDKESIVTRTKKKIFRLVRLIPSVREKLDKELQTVAVGFEKDTEQRIAGQPYFVSLPEKGLSHEEIIKLVNEHLELGDFDWKGGRVSGAVYYFNEDVIKLTTEVYGLASYTNPLHPDIFPGINKMEAEVIKICANLFNGCSDACGTMTTGGTESILMACKAYRDCALEEKGIKCPEIVIPATAHSAFDKAAQFFGLKVRSVPVDPVTTKVDIKAMKRAINGNTIMLAGSAPNFPYGTMDDIEEISKLGVKYNIPVHVDACLGGFVLTFADQANHNLPLFDFRLPGVTSISADTHKYGFAPKGSSVILYSHPKYRHYQFTVTTDWPGGVYGSPTVCGSRAGGIIAACWATMLYFGNEGYVQATKEILATTNYIEKELRKMDGIFIFGKPATTVIALGSKIFDIYRLSGKLNHLGWNLNVLQFPSGIHLCVTHVHTLPGIADKFLNDVRIELLEILKDPGTPVEGKMALYGVAQSIPDRSIVGDFTKFFLDAMYFLPKDQKKQESSD